jgi:tetratricopeptide (TPR) repeat protein
LNYLPDGPGPIYAANLGAAYAVFLAIEWSRNQLNQAVRESERKLKWCEAQFHQNPTSPACRQELGEALLKLGDVLVQRKQSGDIARALEYYNRGVVLREALLKEYPDATQHKRELAMLCERIGELQAERGQSGANARARQYYERSLELCQMLLKANSQSIQAQCEVCIALCKLADLLTQVGDAGDLRRATRHYESALSLGTTLLHAKPGSLEQADILVRAVRHLASYLTQRGQAGDGVRALKYYQQSLELSEALLTQHPDSAEAMRRVALCLEKMGDFLVARGHQGDAALVLQYYQRSLQLREGQLLADPASGLARRNVAVSLGQVACHLAARGGAGDLDRALEYFQRSLELSEALLKDNPSSAIAKRDVAIALSDLAKCQAQRGRTSDTARALDQLQRSLELREGILKQSPASARAQRDVALALGSLADALAERGLPGDITLGLLHDLRALELHESLLKNNPASNQAKRDVAVAVNNLGDMLMRRGQVGDAARALRYYERGLQLVEGLLSENPTSAAAKHDVAANLSHLGSFLAQRDQAGDAAQAAQYFERGLVIAEELRKDNPRSALTVRDVLVSHYTLAMLLINDKAKALSHRRACYDLLHQSVTTGMTFDAPIMDLYETLRHEFQ